jgi:hypothetical protein
MTTPAIWTHDKTDAAYTRTHQGSSCRVGRAALGDWAAVLKRRDREHSAYRFTTADAAMAWCEAQGARA